MKTIIFSTDEKLIEEYRQQGEIVVAKDPIKTLKAMKVLGGKDEYKVVGEDKYVEVAQKMGYNKKEKASDEELIRLVGKLATEHEKQLKEKEVNYTGEIAKLRDNYEQKIKDLEQESAKLKNEFDEKINKLEQEKIEIKNTIKRIVYDEPD